MTTRKPLMIAVLVVMLAMTPLAVGCKGKTKASWVGEPTSFFEGARAQVEKVTSMRISGDVEVGYRFGDMDMAMTAEYEGAFRETQDRGLVGEMKVRSMMAGPQDGSEVPMEVTVYTEGNRIYVQLPGEGKWVYRDFDPAEMWGGISQDPLSLNPQGIMMTLEVAKSLELVEETDDYAVFSFRLDAEKVINDEAVGKFREGLAQFGAVNLGEEEIKKALVEIIDLMKFTIKVDRSSQLPIELTEETTGNILEVLGKLTPQAGMVEGGDMNIRIHLRFSDYGADFPVERPKGIENATPMQGF